MTRRDLLAMAGATPLAGAAAIDRRALVRRHNPIVRKIDPFSPLSVGNGEFAFTTDVTGLQTFPDSYAKGIPLCTMSQWGWHTRGTPPAGGLRLEEYDAYGRKVGYPTSSAGQKELFDWLRENPHRMNLARIGLLTDARADQLTDAEQTLDLWSGVITSRFRLAGEAFTVRTCCHPERDCVVFEVTGNNPGIVVEFLYPSSGISGGDAPSSRSDGTELGENGTSILRRLDGSGYVVELMPGNGSNVRRDGPHRFRIVQNAGGTLRLACQFSHSASGVIPNADETFRASEKHWAGFWSTGGAIDLAGSTDKRAHELERRIVLSQYLTAIQCSGSIPPQETGLTCNSWFGKFHLEMHWWHAAHFALWGRTPMLERSLDWYRQILPVAKENAKQQGYTGARWPKMVGPEGRDSPSPIGPMLIWQQPHIIYMAELAGRRDLADLVFETAEFMASYAVEHEGRFHLGPPVILAQENHPPRETWDPTFELEYWRWGLGVAIEWRHRAGLAPEPRWEKVRRNLAPLPAKDGVYLAHANCPQTFTERNRDHPSMSMALGFLPGEGVDRGVMRATLKKVMREWKWEDTWGWDFPMVAMTAARLGEPQIAVDALMMDAPKNRYLVSGHNYQRPNLPLYLPGNGGLLAATAMMAAKWKGFPAGWNVRSEGLRPLLGA